MRHKWKVTVRGYWDKNDDLLQCKNCGIGPFRRTDVKRGGWGFCRITNQSEKP